MIKNLFDKHMKNVKWCDNCINGIKSDANIDRCIKHFNVIFNRRCDTEIWLMRMKYGAKNMYKYLIAKTKSRGFPVLYGKKIDNVRSHKYNMKAILFKDQMGNSYKGWLLAGKSMKRIGVITNCERDLEIPEMIENKLIRIK
jgi:hypothetical protein